MQQHKGKELKEGEDEQMAALGLGQRRRWTQNADEKATKTNLYRRSGGGDPRPKPRLPSRRRGARRGRSND